MEKTTTKEQMSRILGLTPLRYNNYQATCYVDWCQHYSYNMALPLLALLTSPELQQWYARQWATDVVAPFCRDHQDYLGNIEEPATYQDIFMTYPDRLRNYYPAPILKTLKSNYKHQLKTA